MAKKKQTGDGLIAQNKKAWFDYFIEEEIEAGIVLTGTEVKSLRQGKGSIGEAYATVENGELFLINSFIPEYTHAGTHLQHEPKRHRKLLLNHKEIQKLIGLVQQKGVTIVPLKMYFTSKGRAKVLIGLATGKKQHDKREAIKERDWNRQKAKLMKDF